MVNPQSSASASMPDSPEFAGILDDSPEKDLVAEVFSGSTVETTPTLATPENWFRRHMLKLSIGAFAVGTAFSPIGETLEQVKDNAAWAVAGVAGSEALWIAGAGMMVAATGRRIGNPLGLRKRWDSIKTQTSESTVFKTGLVVNTVGALGTAGVVAGGALTTLPPGTWPGALGIAAADAAATITIRKGIRRGMSGPREESLATPEKAPKFRVRHAIEADIDRLADLDLEGFEGAYGEEAPAKTDVVEAFEKRFKNAPGWMFVVEVAGQVEGFVTAFRTDKSIEEFTSWEDSTANGTLEGRVVPNGEYVYVVNLTMSRTAMKSGGYDSAIANLFANSIRDGVKYGYFVSRMPGFREWVNTQVSEGESPQAMSAEELLEIAQTYFDLKETTDSGEVRHDPQLRMYEQSGFKLKRLVPEAFHDVDSMNFGVVALANIPPKNSTLKSIKPVRSILAGTLRTVAKKPKLLGKIL